MGLHLECSCGIQFIEREEGLISELGKHTDIYQPHFAFCIALVTWMDWSGWYDDCPIVVGHVLQHAVQ